MQPGITFAVDDVSPAEAGLEVRNLSLAERFEVPVRVASHDVIAVVDDGRVHPLVGCVHLAFSEHRPLALSPDAVWITLAQGFARHIDLHNDELQARFVRHEAQKTLRVGIVDPASRDEWTDVFRGFEAQLAESLGVGVVNLFTRPFSTTGPVERVVTCAILMASFRRYFDYEMHTVCGIPSVTLLGTVEDWRDLRRRVDVMTEYGLGWWVEALRPVCDKLVETAEGRPDRDFWRAIYKPRAVYGAKLITGWIGRLFPYLEDHTGETFQNTFALAPEPPDTPHTSYGPLTGPFPRLTSAMSAADRERLYASWWFHEGITATRLPASLSRVLVRLTTDDAELVEVRAGLAAVEQLADGTLRPMAAWAVCEGADAAFWSRFAARYAPPPARPDAPLPVAVRDIEIAGLSGFYSRFDGASLERVALTIRTAAAIEELPAPSFDAFAQGGRALRIGDFGDGSCLDVVPVHGVCPDALFERCEMPAGLRFLEAPPSHWLDAIPRALGRQGYAVAQRRPEGGDVTVIAWSVMEFFQKLSESTVLPQLLVHADAATRDVGQQLCVQLRQRRTRDTRVPFDSREDGLHFGRLDDRWLQPGASHFLVLRTNTPAQQAATQVPAVAKIAAWNDIADVVASERPGVPLRFERRPPREIFAPEGTLCFSLDHTCSHWQNIMNERTFAIYLPPPYDPAEILLSLVEMTITTSPPSGDGVELIDG